VSNDTTTKPRS